MVEARTNVFTESMSKDCWTCWSSQHWSWKHIAVTLKTRLSRYRFSEKIMPGTRTWLLGKTGSISSRTFCCSVLLIYTVSEKKTTNSYPCLCQILTEFSKLFYWYIQWDVCNWISTDPATPQGVTTLPSEMLVFQRVCQPKAQQRQTKRACSLFSAPA